MLYLVSRTDAVDWNEYHDVVVRAHSSEEALRMVTRGFTSADGWQYKFIGYCADGSNASVQQISTDGDPAIICEEFIAA
ncbi:hypothetical protein [Streptomyces sp. NPDC056061]|uniref:hypothetical protein n=1 Tax=Streptomyces sp. NPDC056061 TaxID=3345700 RepID=UPI0035D6C3A5